MSTSAMAPDFQRRVRQLFDAATEHAEAERLAFLKSASGDDQALFSEVAQLLEARRAAQSFLDTGTGLGRRLGRYLIRGELGRGGMGVVYDAFDPVIGRRVAVKVINVDAVSQPGKADLLRDRLFREARSSGQLSHPGIVVVFDVGQEEQSAFIAMELVDGQALEQILSSGFRFEIEEALAILRQIASALDYAHRHGVVHRDIKPANILFCKDGAVKVADFGIAKIISPPYETVTGVVLGTPSYMSPEQIEARSVDGRSDQFSLAVLAYELTTGVRPFEAESIATVAHLIVFGLRSSPRLANPRLPSAWDDIFHRAPARSPHDRFAACEDFVAALQSAFERDQALPSVLSSAALPGKSRTFLLTLVLAAALMLLAGAFIYSIQFSGSAQLPVPKPALPQYTSDNRLDSAPLARMVMQFDINPASVQAGQPATLTWRTADATDVTIEPGIGKVTLQGAHEVVPQASITYTINASNSLRTARRTAFLEVHAAPVSKLTRAKQLCEEGLARRQSGHMDAAFALFQQAADLGDLTAMLELGEIYRSGDGATQDDVRAMHWFRRAADAGNSSGMLLLGAMYALGVNGGDPNDATAAEWFQRAADLNNPSALYDLATLYEDGRGVGKDLEKAKHLYARAAQLGNAEAQKRLNQIQP